MRISFEELDQVIEGFIAVSLLGERGLVPSGLFYIDRLQQQAFDSSLVRI